MAGKEANKTLIETFGRTESRRKLDRKIRYEIQDGEDKVNAEVMDKQIKDLAVKAEEETQLPTVVRLGPPPNPDAETIDEAYPLTNGTLLCHIYVTTLIRPSILNCLSCPSVLLFL